ncbi:MAG: asparagine synthase C-terminal domain-containing protein [Methanomassiliicoccales archaeon]|jgi:asparagine synthase (glutamine-hydrolysing)
MTDTQLLAVNYIDGLLAALGSAADGSFGPEVGVLFSGGVDSCVIAELARRRSRTTLYTIGVKGSHDMTVAEATAKRFGLEWAGTEVREDDIREAVTGIQAVLGAIGPLAISFEMPLYFIARDSKERSLANGQGADEMFGGYARYGTMDARTRREEMAKDVTNLVSSGSANERSLASHFGKTMVHLYLDRRVIDAAAALPDDLLINDGITKVALREVARSLGLIEEAERRKKAAQYGSGVMRMMRSMAKHDGMELRDWVRSLDLSHQEGEHAVR